ncbi:MAG: hypothetical protein ACM3S2_04305 [Ignavibacteriales bacterium]
MKNIQVDVQIFMIKKGDFYVAYAPALELSAYGTTMEEAQEDFGQVLRIFLEETTEAHTLTDVLLDLGWKLQRKPVTRYTPPVFNRNSIKSGKKLPQASRFIKTERKPIRIPV